MENLLEQINQTFENCMNNSSEETKLQLRILQNNINALFQEYMGKESAPIEPSIPVSEPTVTGPAPINDQKKILIVDDSSIVRNYLEKLLKEHYQIEMAEDGKEAIDKLATVSDENPVHLILLDLMMPNIDGFGVLEYMKGKNMEIPIVVISGDNTKETITRAFDFGVVDIIEKPFDSRTIESKIARII